MDVDYRARTLHTGQFIHNKANNIVESEHGQVLSQAADASHHKKQRASQVLLASSNEMSVEARVEADFNTYMLRHPLDPDLAATGEAQHDDTPIVSHRHEMDPEEREAQLKLHQKRLAARAVAKSARRKSFVALGADGSSAAGLLGQLRGLKEYSPSGADAASSGEAGTGQQRKSGAGLAQNQKDKDKEKDEEKKVTAAKTNAVLRNLMNRSRLLQGLDDSSDDEDVLIPLDKPFRSAPLHKLLSDSIDAGNASSGTFVTTSSSSGDGSNLHLQPHLSPHPLSHPQAPQHSSSELQQQPSHSRSQVGMYAHAKSSGDIHLPPMPLGRASGLGGVRRQPTATLTLPNIGHNPHLDLPEIKSAPNAVHYPHGTPGSRTVSGKPDVSSRSVSGKPDVSVRSASSKPEASRAGSISGEYASGQALDSDLSHILGLVSVSAEGRDGKEGASHERFVAEKRGRRGSTLIATASAAASDGAYSSRGRSASRRSVDMPAGHLRRPSAMGTHPSGSLNADAARLHGMSASHAQASVLGGSPSMGGGGGLRATGAGRAASLEAKDGGSTLFTRHSALSEPQVGSGSGGTGVRGGSGVRNAGFLSKMKDWMIRH